MPRADDLPLFKPSHHRPWPGNPLGVKGCGEAGAIGASAAVINAITDAIGNNKLEMPATPDRVWHAIHGNALERGDRVVPYETTSHRPSTVAEAAALFAKGSNSKYLAGGHTLIPAHEAAARAAVRCDRPRARSRNWSASSFPTDAPHHQGGDDLFRYPAKRRRQESDPRDRASDIGASATPQVRFAAPSAARSPTTIRPLIIRRPYSGSGPP